jgi:hypothetical protein
MLLERPDCNNSHALLPDGSVLKWDIYLTQSGQDAKRREKNLGVFAPLREISYFECLTLCCSD